MGLKFLSHFYSHKPPLLPENLPPDLEARSRGLERIFQIRSTTFALLVSSSWRRESNRETLGRARQLIDPQFDRPVRDSV